MKTSKFLIAATALLSLAACGKNASQAVDAIKGTVQDADFATGTWKSQCLPSDVSLLGLAGEKIEYTASSGGLKVTRTYFTEANCVTQGVRIEEMGDYANFNKLPNETNLYTIDETFKNVSVTPLSQAALNLMQPVNALPGYCGMTGWALNQGMDVSANSGNTLCVGIQKVPRAQFDLLQITGTSTLLVGDKDASHDGTTAAARPSTVDPKVVYSH